MLFHYDIGRIELRTLIHHILEIWPLQLFLFQDFKKVLAGQKFEWNEDVIVATEAHFADLEKTYFSDGLKKLEHRWVKCMELRGNYVEK